MKEFNLDFFEAWDELDNINNGIVAKAEAIVNKLPATRDNLLSNGAAFSSNWRSLSKQETKEPGVYIIRNTLTDQLYIGKAASFEERRRDHYLAKPRDSKLLHTAIRKDIKQGVNIGEKYAWARLYTDTENNNQLRSEIEKLCIKKYNTLFKFNGSIDYNLTAGGDGGSGYIYSPEIYNEIAHDIAKHNWTVDREILKLEVEYPDITWRKEGLVKDITEYPEKYKQFIKDFDEITFIDPVDNRLRLRPKKTVTKPISTYADKDRTELVKSYDSVTDAEKDLGYDAGSLGKSISKYARPGGRSYNTPYKQQYYWKYDAIQEPNKQSDFSDALVADTENNE